MRITTRILAALLLWLLLRSNFACAQLTSAVLVFAPDPTGIQPTRLVIAGSPHRPNEDVITNFVLKWTCEANPADPNNCGFIEENAELLPLGPGTLVTHEDEEVSATNFSSETGGKELVELGPIVSPGVTFEQLDTFLTTRTYVAALGSGPSKSLQIVNNWDLSGDGIVDIQDVDMACDTGFDIQGVLATANLLGADADGDGEVQFSDFVILAEHFGNQDTMFSTGDFDCDNETQFSDFVMLNDVFGQRSVPAAAVVPEPSAPALFVVGILLLGLARRRDCGSRSARPPKPWGGAG